MVAGTMVLVGRRVLVVVGTVVVRTVLVVVGTVVVVVVWL